MQDQLLNMRLEVAAGYYDLRLYDRYLQQVITLEPIAARYGFVDHLADELQELQKSLTRDPSRMTLQRLRALASQAMRVESERGNELVAVANAEFFRRLLERFPDLTNNDLRV